LAACNRWSDVSCDGMQARWDSGSRGSSREGRCRSVRV
jgi:hypothetical protein